MKLWGAYVGAMVVSAIAGCGGDFRSGTGSPGVDAGETGGKPDTGGSGSAESGGAISDGGSAGKASGGRAGHGGAGNGGASSGGKAGSSNGGAATGGVAGSSSGGSAAGGATGGAGSGGVSTGGAAGGVQRAIDYDQRCQDDTNCALVNEGTVCDCDSCSNAAISSGAVAKWNNDRASFNCKALPCAFLPCPTVAASCAKGTCIARTPLVIAADNYDRACSSVSDCVAITLGDPCSTCLCALGAVSKKGYEAYKLDIAAALGMCTPPPVGCGCAPAGMPACSTSMGQAGVCVIQ